MTEAEWHHSDDAGAMLDYLWQRRGVSPDRIGLRFGGNVQESDGAGEELGSSLHRFYLTSCRGIWPLLPQEASRRGVELAEQFLAGQATAQAVSEYNWHTEGAAFRIDYAATPGDTEAIAGWVAQVEGLPAGQLRAMLHPPATADEIGTRELLLRAAYFADFAMVYPSLRPQGPPPASYRPFLSAELLRRHVGYPGAAGE